jgi:DNA-binding NarL/FixJ family response regulator
VTDNGIGFDPGKSRFGGMGLRSDAEIGKTLHLGEATVRTHIHNILQRHGLENRSQAVAYANRPR